MQQTQLFRFEAWATCGCWRQASCTRAGTAAGPAAAPRWPPGPAVVFGETKRKPRTYPYLDTCPNVQPDFFGLTRNTARPKSGQLAGGMGSTGSHKGWNISGLLEENFTFYEWPRECSNELEEEAGMTHFGINHRESCLLQQIHTHMDCFFWSRRKKWQTYCSVKFLADLTASRSSTNRSEEQ